MLYLQNKGVPFGDDGIIHTTARKRRNYYVTESEKCMELLNKYRKNSTK